jgi:predicted DNA-binding protein
MKQIQTAQLMAKGLPDKDVWPKAGVAESTLYRWKKDKDFQDCLSFFQREELEKGAALAALGDADELAQSRADEVEMRKQIKKLAENTCKLANDLIETVIEAGVDELSPRMIPSLVKAATDAVGCLRDGNDRLTGLEGLLDELGKIEKEISARGYELHGVSESKAA